MLIDALGIEPAAEGVGVARLGATACGWIRFLVGTNGERFGYGAEILLVRWGPVDGGLLVTGEGALRGILVVRMCAAWS